MKNDALRGLLQELGLTENEAVFYLSALSLGSSPIQKIAREANMKRTTAYSVMESLKQKGLVVIEVKGFKQLFSAVGPRQLEQMLEQRRERFRQALPELEAVQSLPGGESFLKYYEGLEAIKGLYWSVSEEFRPGQEYLAISDAQHWINLDPGFFEKFKQTRAKHKIKTRLLLQDSSYAQENKKFEKNYGERIKILPKGTSLNTSAMILPNKVVIHQLTPPILAVVIENKSVVQMHREMFEIIWKSLK